MRTLTSSRTGQGGPMRLLSALLCTAILLGALVPHSRAQEPDLLDLLPSYADVGADAVLVPGGARTLGEHAARFNAPDEASQLLTAWGWEANAWCDYESRQLSE